MNGCNRSERTWWQQIKSHWCWWRCPRLVCVLYRESWNKFSHSPRKTLRRHGSLRHVEASDRLQNNANVRFYIFSTISKDDWSTPAAKLFAHVPCANATPLFVIATKKYWDGTEGTLTMARRLTIWDQKLLICVPFELDHVYRLWNGRVA